MLPVYIATPTARHFAGEGICPGLAAVSGPTESSGPAGSSPDRWPVLALVRAYGSVRGARLVARRRRVRTEMLASRPSFPPLCSNPH